MEMDQIRPEVLKLCDIDAIVLQLCNRALIDKNRVTERQKYSVILLVFYKAIHLPHTSLSLLLTIRKGKKRLVSNKEDTHQKGILLKINVQNHLEITYKLKNNVQNTFKYLLSNCVRYYYNNNVQSL